MESEMVRTRPAERLLETGEALPLLLEPRAKHHTKRRKNLRSEARRRRVIANVFFVCSSLAAVAVVAICYALLMQ